MGILIRFGAKSSIPHLKCDQNLLLHRISRLCSRDANWYSNWVKLAQNGTNLGLFKISFSTCLPFGLAFSCDGSVFVCPDLQ